MDAQDIQDLVSGVWCLVIPGIRRPAPDHRPSRLPVQQPLVLFILCILCIDVNCEGIFDLRRRAGAPHRISLRLPARLLRLPLQGGARASRPHPDPTGDRCASARLCRQPPRRREPQRPGRRRAVAPLPVDPSGGDGRGCAGHCAGVPPAQDLAGSWRFASQGWSVHPPTGAGAAPLQECGRDARAPRGKPMASQCRSVQSLQIITFATPMSCPTPNFAKGSGFTPC